MTRISARTAGALGAVVAALLLGSCAPSAAPQQPAPDIATASPWPVTTRDHVDLWLHGFAMIQDDTARIPLFERDYRQRLAAVKSRANVRTALDANRETLRAGIAARPALVNAQFLALYFGSWNDLRRASELFVQAEGDPRRTGDAQLQTIIATFANVFPTRQDREWLRIFVTSLEEERERFYGPYWTAQQGDRRAARERLDSLWENNYRPRFQRYLNNTQLARGTFILSLPIGGEGRTVLQRPPGAMIVTPHPEQPQQATDAIFVFAHEASIPVAQSAVDDNITPAERRDGVATRYVSNGTVRGGALLLERVAPELVDGYMRYYLRAAGLAAPTGNPRQAFTTAFALPEAIHAAISSQLDAVMGGI